MVRNSTAVLVSLLTLTAAPCPAASPEEAGRKIFSEHMDAVVTVTVVAEMTMSVAGYDRPSETKSDTIGTVVDESGLTVISLSAIDPSNALEGWVRQQAQRSGADADFNIKTKVTDVTMVLADGTEIEASVVLRDKDLDLAYLKPSGASERSFAHVDLSDDAVPQVLDQTVALYRMGSIGDRQATASLERINAMVKRPRPYYVLGVGQGSSGIGSPVFNLDGKLLGILLLRTAAPDSDGNLASMFAGSAGMGILPVIVPAADVRRDAQQALAPAAKDR